MSVSTEYKYFAFISYNSHDTVWGKRLQRKLEGYKMPSTLCSEHGWERKPIKPVFFAPTDIQPGGLSEELQERLKASRNLIVICSPNSAKSKWVGAEIAYFHSLGRTKNIHFFIVDGIPHSGDPKTECFNPVIDELGLPEILGANINEKVHRWPWLNKERAYVQLVTKLLGVGFDDIWQRHRRMLIRNVTLWVIGGLMIIAALLGSWYFNRSVDVKMEVVERSEHNANLPVPGETTVTIQLENEVKCDTIPNFDSKAFFANIPQKFIGKDVKISVGNKDFKQLDTVVSLKQNLVLNMFRNPNIYGHVKVRIYKFTEDGGTPVPDQKIMIDGREAVSDSSGWIVMDIPLNEQKTSYEVTASVPLETNSISMPCGSYEAVLLK